MESPSRIEILRGMRSRLQTKKIEANQYLNSLTVELKEINGKIVKACIQEDCEKESGTEGNPKSDLLFEKAWKWGQGDRAAVMCQYRNLVDLIK